MNFVFVVAVKNIKSAAYNLSRFNAAQLTLV